MDRPRSLGNNHELDILKAKLAHLETEISAPDDVQKNDMSYDSVLVILQNEIASYKDQIEFETTLKQKLLEDDKRLSLYIQEEKHILKCIDQYLEKNPKLNESILDERKELYFKLELLHRKFIILIKKFSKRYFPLSQIHHSDDIFDDGDFDASEENKPKKSLLNILSTLITELSDEENAEEKTGILHVDDTIWKGYINFLICANIIEWCPDSNSVKLK